MKKNNNNQKKKTSQLLSAHLDWGFSGKKIFFNWNTEDKYFSTELKETLNQAII